MLPLRRHLFHLLTAPVVDNSSNMSGTAAPKEKRLRTPAKKHAEHPEHAIMIVEAIATLKERSGSSTAAINKVIGDKYKGKLPTGWERVTSQQLQRLLDKGELVKVKASYKLGEDVLKKKPKAKQSKAESEKEVVEPKSDKLKEGEKKKKKKAGATPNEAEKAVPKKAAEKKPAKAKAPKARAEKKKPAAKPKAAQPEAAKA
eukprot:GHRQ01001337.1.p1 GENE.GHRQ01001337.1~~GHRQ01001337.1.p1  ORF type:complete len:202 (+),score=85.64 GHRQ01001337.1:121-726(+)